MDYLLKINEQYIFLAVAESDGSLTLMTINGNVKYSGISTLEKNDIKNQYLTALSEVENIEKSSRQRFISKYTKEY